MKLATILTFFTLVIFLQACEQDTSETLTSVSPDSSMKIMVQGSRYSSLDPYNLQIVSVMGDMKDTVTQEAFVKEVNKETISFDWRSESYCIVRISEKNGEVIEVPVKYTIVESGD